MEGTEKQRIQSFVPAELSAAGDYPVVGAEGVMDYTQGKSQEQLNAELLTALQGSGCDILTDDDIEEICT